MTDRTKNWAEMAADCAIDAASATGHDNAMEWIGLGVASALLAIHDTLIADRYAANEAKQRGEAEPDPLAADADKWQRAALTLQGDRDALTDERDSLSWQVEALRAERDARSSERDALAAKLERVRRVHESYFDIYGRPGRDYTIPEPDDVWRFDRDLRAALDGAES